MREWPPYLPVDWPEVLDHARELIARYGVMPRPELWQRLVADGNAPPHGKHGFRAFLAAAQERGEFPTLPRASTGPDKGTPWTEDRHDAERARHDEPTPYELYTERLGECWRVLQSVNGIRTVRLSPSAFRIFAINGYGEEIVLHAVHQLVSAGLARLCWEVHGMERVPVIQHRAA
jgi:hypothetical protein